ncbi:MAG: hypothetical protein CFE31_05945 [Rhizobiales bacterium PAR1]|nr:MAG: hypothetical protein CFE31_05945 [Rhizobiales bacterium PAR1]
MATKLSLHSSPHAHVSCCEAHRVSPVETLRAAEAICAQNGLRMTPQRRAVLVALVEAKKPLGAYDLIEALREEGQGRSPAPIAIYRALDFLREQGFIHRLETLNAFIACPHLHGREAQEERVMFLICEACHHAEEVATSALTTPLATIAAEHGFVAKRQVIELAGLCRHCAQHAPKA